MILGARIELIRYSSFYMKDELIEKYNVLYFKLDTFWYRCTVSDGRGVFKQTNEPLVVSRNNISDDFKYPISELKDKKISENVLNRKISAVKEITYLYSDSETEVVGYRINLQNNHFVVIYDNVEKECIELLLDIELSDSFVEHDLEIS